MLASAFVRVMGLGRHSLLATNRQLRMLHDAIVNRSDTSSGDDHRLKRRPFSHVAQERELESLTDSEKHATTSVFSVHDIRPKGSATFSDREVDEMITRCIFVLDLKHKLFGSRFSPWPSAAGVMTKEQTVDRVSNTDLGIRHSELENLIRQILLRDDSLTSFGRAVHLMAIAFWDVCHRSSPSPGTEKRRNGYLPWTMTADPWPYQIRRFGHPLPHYVSFYRVFMNVMGFQSPVDFDTSGIPKRIANLAKYRNVMSKTRVNLTQKAPDMFTFGEIADMKSRCQRLLLQPPNNKFFRNPHHLWPGNIPLEDRIISLNNPFGDEELHSMLLELLLRPDALQSLQLSVRFVHEMFWSRDQVLQCYLPSTCNGLIRQSQLGRKPLPHHEHFYSIFMQLFGYPNAQSFSGSEEERRVFRFTLHLNQWERSSRLSLKLQRQTTAEDPSGG